MARIISNNTFNSVTKLLKDSLKSVSNAKVKIHLKMLLDDLDDSDVALGYED